MSIQLYSSLDKTKDGKISSEYPVWYHDVHLDNLKESVESNKRRLSRGDVPRDQVNNVKSEIEIGEEKLKIISRSYPTLTDAEKDKLCKLYKEELCPLISETLFTYDQMQKGIASGHEEAKRMVQPTIPIKSVILADMIEETGGRIVNKKVCRNDLVKVFKLVGKLIGEPSNLEVLRK
jgi:hypothetical protein